MIYNSTSAQKIATYLLEIKAVILQPNHPFTWASGWKSPIYCDNRMILSFPEVRNFVKNEFSNLVKEKYSSANVIAGVATAGIPHAALIADELGLPMGYIRSKPKEHGTQKLIEGKMDMTSKVLVVEDLISTAKSSIQAIQGIKSEVNSIEGLVSIFDYGFEIARNEISKNNLSSYSLCDYDTLLAIAVQMNYVSNDQVETLTEWKLNPSQWNN